MKLHFITFADGIKPKYRNAATKLCEMIGESKLFSSMKIFTVQDLIEDTTFWNQHKDFFQRSPRGFGYWLWKPYIISKTLSQVEEGDIVLYADACTTFNVKAKDRFIDYVNMLLQSPQKSFYFKMSDDLTIRQWTKKDTLYQLDATELVDLPVVVSTVLMVSNTRYNRSLFEYIYTLCSDYHLIDDSPSVLPNDTQYREHRHDQSIFSILLRKLCPSSVFNIDGEWYFSKNEPERFKYPFWIQSNEY